MSITLHDLTDVNEPTSTPISDAIKTSMAEALAIVPEGKTGAALAYVDSSGVVHGAIALKLQDQWTLWANADYHGTWEGSAGVRFSW